MCGIWCCITAEAETSHLLKSGGSSSISRGPTIEPKCSVCASSSFGKVIMDDVIRQNQCLSRRGPDSSQLRCLSLNTGESRENFEAPSPSQLKVHLQSHVLWTQGEKVYQQPYTNKDHTKFMLYNGDIYSFEGFTNESESETSFKHSSNDGSNLFNLFDKSSNDATEICNVIGNLQGPFAFIFVDLVSKQLWFGRDFFGRESLIFSYETQKDSSGSWNISSVSVFRNVFEVPTSGFFCVNLETRQLRIYPYSHLRKTVSELEVNFISALQASGFIFEVIPSSLVNDIHIELHFNSKLTFPESEEVVLQNNTLMSLIYEAKGETVSAEEFLKRSLKHLSCEIEEFLKWLRKSVQRRVSVLPPFCKDCLKLVDTVSTSPAGTCNHAKVGVLFSGGVDSTVLAYLAAEALPEGSTLDLINVAFSKTNDFNNVPDRETALASYKMLEENFTPQGKTINLVLVNVSKPEVEEQRKEKIKDLISPLKSVLDDSVGVCLWFAARGRGCLYKNGEDLKVNSSSNEYISPIRVVLLGSGADELLGGYGRHRSAYEKSGWLGLASEMQLEIDRISIRNLGRDNRIVSDHGLCPRMPFLDENVVDFLTSRCDLWVKCCPVNVGPLGTRGSGEKLLLRAVGATLFGDLYLPSALFPKRAMQFGSRIAKLENSKEKGGDSCQRLY